ncbi:MAG: hypothetical protein VX693_10135 [Pseudomonadota bacterium]|nr:hypothetical protein [Pseudomonadota bacterium]
MPEKELQNAINLVKNFLSAMENRNLILAKSFLGDNFKLIFPKNQIFFSLEEVIFWGQKRYNWVKKNYDHFDSLITKNTIIVYCYGTLYGEWLDGNRFSEIRFIDRFTIKDEKLLDQLVWNDLAEYKRD